MNLARELRKALKRVMQKIDLRIHAAHANTAHLAEFHRRGLAQRYRTDRINRRTHASK